MTKHGSAEHFQQVIKAHVVLPTGTCRCLMAHVGHSDAAYRAHIEQVWKPHALPDDWPGVVAP